MSIEKDYLKDARFSVEDVHIKKYLDFLYAARTDLLAFKADLRNYETSAPDDIKYDASKDRIIVEGTKMELVLSRWTHCSAPYADWAQNLTDGITVGSDNQFFLIAKMGYGGVVKIDKQFRFVSGWGCAESSAPPTNQECFYERVISLTKIEQDGNTYVLAGTAFYSSTIKVYQIDELGEPTYVTQFANPTSGRTAADASILQNPTQIYYDSNNRIAFIVNTESSDWRCCCRGYVSIWDLSDITNPQPIKIIAGGIDECMPFGIYYNPADNHLVVAYENYIVVYHYDPVNQEAEVVKRITGTELVNFNNLRRISEVGNFLLIPDNDPAGIMIMDKSDYEIKAYLYRQTINDCSPLFLDRPEKVIVNPVGDDYEFVIIGYNNRIYRTYMSSLLQDIDLRYKVEFGTPVKVHDVLIDKVGNFIDSYSVDGITWFTKERFAEAEVVSDKLYIKLDAPALIGKQLNISEEAYINGIYVIGEFPK